MEDNEKSRQKKMKKIGDAKVDLALYSKNEIVKRDSD